MSNTARKARKRAGIPFVRVAEVGTPLEDQSVPPAFDRNGRATGPSIQHASMRGIRRLAGRITAAGRGPEVVAKKATPKKKKVAAK